jgi:hypothetical protein
MTQIPQISADFIIFDVGAQSKIPLLWRGAGVGINRNLYFDKKPRSGEMFVAQGVSPG